MILMLRTDKPDSELGLYEAFDEVSHITWPAHRQLAETLHSKIAQLLQDQSRQLTDVTGIVAYKGPGSFTGLRIGLSVANAIAASYSVPIVATNGDDWIHQGIEALQQGAQGNIALPEYGSAPHITAPKK